MAELSGVVEKLGRPQRSLIKRSPTREDLAAWELQTAKEILAEVFRIRMSEVEEMILNRSKEACSDSAGCQKDALWPQEFRLDC